MNYRQSDQRGVIYPVPQMPNANSTAPLTGTTGGNEGLWDIVLDSTRNLVYITNSGYNRIEVFDTVNRVFLNPIPVGQMPHQMALSSDSNTLYVGNTGGESISIVDLTQMAVVGTSRLPGDSPAGRRHDRDRIESPRLGLRSFRTPVPAGRRYRRHGFAMGSLRQRRHRPCAGYRDAERHRQHAARALADDDRFGGCQHHL